MGDLSLIFNGMFENLHLPTLDTEIWWDGASVRYSFYEKPQCPNKVLQRDTALSDSSIFSSLTQEVVRRMLSCCPLTTVVERQNILSKFAQKVRNSGFSVSSTQIILVHGITRYLELVEKSKLRPNHKNFRPLHVEKGFKLLERKLAKFTMKSDWYSSDKLSDKVNWRQNLPEEWKGTKPIQFKVPNMKYTSLLQVPSTKGSKLLKAIARSEPRLAKASGYHVKVV